MKKLNLLLLISLLCISCSNSSEDSLQEMSPDSLCVVTFGIGNFSADVTTRAGTGSTIYGINVYYDKEKDGKQNDIYAYGLFDSTNGMKITLLSGYKYKFVCSVVRDAKDKLYYGPISNNNYSGYAQPFQLSNSVSTAVQNKFITGTSAYLSGLESGVAVIQNSSSYVGSGNFPSLERYYGEYADYSPQPNDRIIIPLKRTFFGNKLIVNGVSDGKATVTCKIDNTTVWQVSDITNNYSDDGVIYSYHDVYNCWKNESNLKASVGYRYDSNRGTYWDQLKSKDITFKRNVMTTITININPDFSGGTIGVTEEPLGDDNLITLLGDSGELIEVNVDPNEE